jgi:hypothetical protein
VVPPRDSGGAIYTDTTWTGRVLRLPPHLPDHPGEEIFRISHQFLYFSYAYILIILYCNIVLYFIFCILFYLFIDCLHRKLISAEPRLCTIGNLQ